MSASVWLCLHVFGLGFPSIQVCNLVEGSCVPAGDVQCVCQSADADAVCNETYVLDGEEPCHFCNHVTVELEDEAKAVGESAAISGAKLVGMVIAMLLIDSRYGG
jgi:hypothetical protein